MPNWHEVQSTTHLNICAGHWLCNLLLCRAELLKMDYLTSWVALLASSVLVHCWTENSGSSCKAEPLDWHLGLVSCIIYAGKEMLPKDAKPSFWERTCFYVPYLYYMPQMAQTFSWPLAAVYNLVNGGLESPPISSISCNGPALTGQASFFDLEIFFSYLLVRLLLKIIIYCATV